MLGAIAFVGLPIVLLVLIWDRARGGLPFWQQQTLNYGDIRLAYSHELGPRLSGWLAFLPYFFGPLVGVIGLSALVAVSFRVPLGRGMTLFAWLVGIFALHWLFNFPMWDRNPNTGHPFAMDAALQTADQTIHHDADHPSSVTLPIIPYPIR